MDIQKLVENMSVEELCGQVLSYDIQPGDTDEETFATIEKIIPGSLFVCPEDEDTMEKLAPRFERNKGFAVNEIYNTSEISEKGINLKYSSIPHN